MKFKLDSLSSHTTKFLEVLNNYLNIYKKPHDDLKSIIDSYVKFLIDSIDHDINQLDQLSNLLSEFDRNQHLLQMKINIITGSIKNIPFKNITRYYSVIYPVFLNIRSRLYKVATSFNDFKMKYINIKIRDIRFNISSLSYFKQKLNEIKSLLSSIKTIHEYINIKNKLSENLGEKFISLDVIESIENLLKYMKTYDNLSLVSNGVSSLKSDITKEKNKLFTYLSKVKHWKSILPDQISSEEKRSRRFEPLKDNFPVYKRIIENINHENESRRQLLKYSQQLERFLSERSDNVENIISLIDRFKLCIDNANSKLQMSKSNISKPKLIEYIITLIDTINFIIKVEPSQIVEHFKPIYSIKPELESIITSIRIMDIQSDIFNLKNLYSQIVDINSFSTNMKKLKEYISSVESHIGGTDQIVKSLRNIENLINSNYIKLISYDLDVFYDKQYSKHNSKLPEDDPVKKYMDDIKNYTTELKRKNDVLLSCISSLTCIVIELNREVEITNSEISCIKSDIMNLECAIEGAARNFIRCSLKSLRIHVITGRNCVNHNRDNNNGKVNKYNNDKSLIN